MIEDVEPCRGCSGVREASGGHASWTSEGVVRPNNLAKKINVYIMGI